MSSQPQTWHPTLGACLEDEGVRFRVWTDKAQRVEVALYPPQAPPVFVPLERQADGLFSALVPGIGPGMRYRYRLHGVDLFPDPASRFQPEGVHGPSEVVDGRAFAWTDAGWRGIDPADLVIYELHVGTFTPEGTYASAIERLPYLADLGVTALELLPVADFAGQRNWGYDGVSLFAPARCYGRPDDLRRLIDAAHRLGLAVLLDVVYNHLGPDGNYLAAYCSSFFSHKNHTPWGPALNFDGPGSVQVRRFVIENALYWIHEFHCDGLRLDATQAITDTSSRHLLAELAQRVKETTPGRSVVLIAEDMRNLSPMLQPAADGGWGLDGVWNDDFHHQVRRYLAGDSEGYYRDFRGTLADLAVTLRDGWLYRGQHSVHWNRLRGTDPAPVRPRQLVNYLQNHDQVGNRAVGDRLHHRLDPAGYRAATVLLLTAPQTPLLFMGQEWGASTPFLFFTDHHERLGRRITEGRRAEYRAFAAFADPRACALIPDPQAVSTFLTSRLRWEETEREPHASLLRLHRALLRLRRQEPALRGLERCACEALDDNTLVLGRTSPDGSAVLIVFRFRERGAVPPIVPGWQPVLSTEDAMFCPDPRPIRVETTAAGLLLTFTRPGALVLRRERPSS
jgi:maltooligosyltrehalose trehalohydrolase